MYLGMYVDMCVDISLCIVCGDIALASKETTGQRAVRVVFDAVVVEHRNKLIPTPPKSRPDVQEVKGRCGGRADTRQCD